MLLENELQKVFKSEILRVANILGFKFGYSDYN